MREPIRIGTRGSTLALWQANHIKTRLKKELGLEATLKIVKTSGDKILNMPLVKIGGKGLFTKELEDLLLCKEIDIAVHSLKDVPVEFVENLGLACITKREDARDCFLSYKYASINDLPSNARVGTTSLRRSMQLNALREGLDTLSLRGNIQTRLKKLEQGDFDAIILANAGLKRLGISEIPYIVPIPIDTMIPAMGQASLGVECCLDNPLFETLSILEDTPSAICSNAERGFVRELGGSCQTPIGVNCSFLDKHNIKIQAIIGLPNGKEILKEEIVGEGNNALNLAKQLAKTMLKSGAKDILNKAMHSV